MSTSNELLELHYGIVMSEWTNEPPTPVVMTIGEYCPQTRENSRLPYCVHTSSELRLTPDMLTQWEREPLLPKPQNDTEVWEEENGNYVQWENCVRVGTDGGSAALTGGKCWDGTTEDKKSVVGSKPSSKPYCNDERQLNPTSPQHGFNYIAAMNYVHRLLVPRKGYASSEDVARRRDATAGKEKKVVKVTQEKGRKAKPRKAKKVSSSAHETRQRGQHDVDYGVILDIVQNAFLKYWQSDLPNVEHNIIATTFKLCHECYLDHCKSEMALKRKQVYGGDGDSVLEQYADKIAWAQWSAQEGEKSDDEMTQTIINWLASGASQTDVAQHFGVPKQRVSDYVVKLRAKYKRDAELDELDGGTRLNHWNYGPSFPASLNTLRKPLSFNVETTERLVSPCIHTLPWLDRYAADMLALEYRNSDDARLAYVDAIATQDAFSTYCI